MNLIPHQGQPPCHGGGA